MSGALQAVLPVISQLYLSKTPKIMLNSAPEILYLYGPLSAGSDVVLGMIPFMRELLKRGTEVVLAVNSVPSINDITVPEMQSIMEHACDIDSILCAYYKLGKWRLISSGNDLPVIDLRLSLIHI